MKVLKLTSVALALASLSLVASCADEQESIIIAGAPAWGQGCSVMVPASEFLGRGLLDLRFGTAYMVPLEIQNQLQPQAAQSSNSGTDTSEFQIVGADVTISSAQNPEDIQRLRDDPDGGDAYVEFSPTVPTNSLGGNDTLGMAILGIPAATAAKLGEYRVEEAKEEGDMAAELMQGASEQDIAAARRSAEAEVLLRKQELIVSIVIRARRTGNDIGDIGEIEAREFRFPVDVCYGCLLSCATCEEPGQCPMGSVPVDDTDRLFIGDFVGANLGCPTAQDDYVVPASCG